MFWSVFPGVVFQVRRRTRGAVPLNLNASEFEVERAAARSPPFQPSQGEVEPLSISLGGVSSYFAMQVAGTGLEDWQAKSRRRGMNSGKKEKRLNKRSRRREGVSGLGGKDASVALAEQSLVPNVNEGLDR